MAVEVVPAGTSRHFRDSARLHADGITEGFLSTLGEPFLAVLYEGIATAEDSGVLVAEEDGFVLGFISYTSDVKGCYRQVLRSKWPRLVLNLLPSLLRPVVYRKIFETLIYPLTHRGKDDSGNGGPGSTSAAGHLRSELLSMAVAPQARGKGVGKLLVKAVDEALTQIGLTGYFVVTHAVDERSNGFYRRCGFELYGEYVSHGKPMNEYFKSI